MYRTNKHVVIFYDQDSSNALVWFGSLLEGKATHVGATKLATGNTLDRSSILAFTYGRFAVASDVKSAHQRSSACYMAAEDAGDKPYISVIGSKD